MEHPVVPSTQEPLMTRETPRTQEVPTDLAVKLMTVWIWKRSSVVGSWYLWRRWNGEPLCSLEVIIILL